MSKLSKRFSRSWKSSSKPKKQKKYRMNSPLHVKQGIVHSHLSKELRKKYKLRSIGVKKGDKVKIMRGQFKKRTGNVEEVDIKNIRVFVAGIEMQRKEGSKSFYPLHPSNLQIIELAADDKRRINPQNKQEKTKNDKKPSQKE